MISEATGSNINITTVDALKGHRDKRCIHLVVGKDSPFRGLADEIGSIGNAVPVVRLTIEQQQTSAPLWANGEWISLSLALGGLQHLQSIHLKGLKCKVIGGIPLHLVTPPFAGSFAPVPAQGACHYELSLLHSCGGCGQKAGAADRIAAFGLGERASTRPSIVGHPTTMKAVFGLPSLQGLAIAAFYPDGKPTSHTLGALDDDWVGRLAGNGCYRTLRIDHLQLGQQTLVSLARAFNEPGCVVKRLWVDVSDFRATQVNTFFEALCGDTRIEKLVIEVSFSVDWKANDCLRQLVTCLSHNRSISAVKVFNGTPFLGADFEDQDAVPFVKMLEKDNYTLTYLELVDYNAPDDEEKHGKLAPMIAYYTRSNAGGRKKALQTLTKDSANDWSTRLLTVESPVMALSEHQQHVQVVYYWNRQNPGLFVNALLSKVIE